MRSRLALPLSLLALAAAPAAGAQTVWVTGRGALPLQASFSVGLGLNLPLGLGTLGVELTPLAVRPDGNLRSAGLVLRDVPLPLTPISLRAEAGLEQFGPGGSFGGAPLTPYLGAGVRYGLAGLVGLQTEARTSLGGAGPSFSVSLGLDLKF